MRNFGRAVCMLAALPAAFPILAQAQTTTAYDGTYRGISRQLEGGSLGGGTRSCALPNGVPEPLTILNGVARAGAADKLMEGDCNAEGVLTMRSQRGSVQGSIGVQGRATGRLTAGCSYSLFGRISSSPARPLERPSASPAI